VARQPRTRATAVPLSTAFWPLSVCADNTDRFASVSPTGSHRTENSPIRPVPLGLEFGERVAEDTKTVIIIIKIRVDCTYTVDQLVRAAVGNIATSDQPLSARHRPTDQPAGFARSAASSTCGVHY